MTGEGGEVAHAHAVARALQQSQQRHRSAAIGQDLQPRDDIDDFWIDQWDIVEGTTKRYEYWVLGAGDGTVFHAGKIESLGIGSTQHSFEAFEGDHDEALVAALQAAADKANL